MKTQALFRLSRWASGLTVVLSVGAMLVYPGGTILDPNATGYSFLQNFLSDLGMTVAHGGRSNILGAGLFVGSFSLLVMALASCAVAFVRVHSSAPRARSFAYAGGFGAVVVGVALLGAALSPVNVFAPLHMWFARTASAIAPAAVLFFAIASARDQRVPAGVSIAWLVLAFATGVWFLMRWGPSVDTNAGLMVQATVQKAVGMMVVGAVIYGTYRGGRLLQELAEQPTAPANTPLQPTSGGRVEVH